METKALKVLTQRRKCIEKYKNALEKRKTAKMKKEHKTKKVKAKTSAPSNNVIPSKNIIIQFHSKSKDQKPPFTKSAMRDLSNFADFDVEYQGKIYSTVEHAFQAQKGFCVKGLSEEDRERFVESVRSAKTPLEAKSAGEKSAMKKAGMVLDIDCWNKKSRQIMNDLIKSKVERHSDIRNILEIIKRQNMILVHFSRSDMLWGAHVDNNEITKGQNKLGETYMDLVKKMNI